MPLTFTDTPLYYKDSPGNYHRILSGADMTGYRTAAAQDAIDAGLVSAVAAQSFNEAQQAQARTNIGAASEQVLLWENANPYSNFAPQTIALDLHDYNYVGIRCVSETKSDSPITMMNIFPIDGSASFIFDIRAWNGGGAIQMRYIGVYSTGIYFDYGRRLTLCTPSNNSYNGNNDAVIVPYQIYGMR